MSKKVDIKEVHAVINHYEEQVYNGDGIGVTKKNSIKDAFRHKNLFRKSKQGGLVWVGKWI